MTAHRITDALSRLTAGGLTAIGNAPSWVTVLILLGAGTQGFTAVLASISTFRAESAQRRQRDRLLNLADPDRGLTHLERITQHTQPPTQPQPPTRPRPTRATDLSPDHPRDETVGADVLRRRARSPPPCGSSYGVIASRSCGPLLRTLLTAVETGRASRWPSAGWVSSARSSSGSWWWGSSQES